MKERKSPLDPRALTDVQVRALQAVWQGKADPAQQRVALEAIIDDIAETDAVWMVTGPDGARLTDFALGKKWVGKTIRSACNTALTRLVQRSQG